MRKITEIILHCTATKEGANHSVDEIRMWHKAQGWSDIGYHYVIYLDGSIHEGRKVEVVGAHCYGHNRESIGVVYVGGLDKNGKPKDTRTDAQRKSLRELVKSLQKLYPKASVHGHNEFEKKACPCFNVKTEL